MPTVQLKIGLRCRALLGSGVPRLHINGLNLLGFCMQRFGGTNGRERKKIYQCSIRHTQPRGFFPQVDFFSLYIYFSCSRYGIGKRERGAREEDRRGRWYETSFISLCPQSWSGWATRMMFLVHIFLNWTGETKRLARNCSALSRT